MGKLAEAVFGNKYLFYKRQHLAEASRPWQQQSVQCGCCVWWFLEKQRVHHFLAWRLSSVTAGFALPGPQDF